MPALFHVVLFEPEIPPNTGNIIRLCANTGCELHLIHPLGFNVDNKSLQRAGLDYHDLMIMHEHPNFTDFLSKFPESKIFAIETCGGKIYSQVQFKPGDCFLFGPETRGLPKHVIEHLPKDRILKIPMQKDIRSLNLSNSAAIVIYEAWRQNQFIILNSAGKKPKDPRFL